MFTLERFLDHARTPPIGCVGELYDPDGDFICYTMEQPWRNNKPFVSCVPCGEYEIKKINTPKHGDTAVLVNHELNIYATHLEAGATGRYSCLFHAANWSHQIEGCIALGESLAWGKHVDHPANLMITNSRATVERVLPDLIDESILIKWKNSN